MKQNYKFLSNWAVKIFSFILAVLVVLLVEFSNITGRTVTIPVSVLLPGNGLVPESLVPETVDVVIKGSESIIYLVDPSEIKAYADFSGVEEAGITRVPVVLDFDEDVYSKDSIAVKADPSSLRILFSTGGGNG